MLLHSVVLEWRLLTRYERIARDHVNRVTKRHTLHHIKLYALCAPHAREGAALAERRPPRHARPLTASPLPLLPLPLLCFSWLTPTVRPSDRPSHRPPFPLPAPNATLPTTSPYHPSSTIPATLPTMSPTSPPTSLPATLPTTLPPPSRHPPAQGA